MPGPGPALAPPGRAGGWRAARSGRTLRGFVESSPADLLSIAWPLRCETISHQMTSNHGLPLVAPKVVPVLEPGFRPAVLAVRAFDALARESGSPVAVRMALEQADGSVFHFETRLLPSSHTHSAGNCRPPRAIRQVPSLVTRRLADATSTRRPTIAARLAAHYRETLPEVRLAPRRPADVRSSTRDRPHARPAAGTRGDQAARPSLDGCRIGFDLGGSDRKVAAVIDGPCRLQRRDGLGSVPQAGSAISLRRDHGFAHKAAAHLPRVDAIGGSAAGVYVNNRVKVGRCFAVFRKMCSTPACMNCFLTSQSLAQRAVGSRQRWRGHGARRLDVARTELDSWHCLWHQHGRRLRHARWQHHLVAQRTGVRARGLQSGRPDR